MRGRGLVLLVEDNEALNKSNSRALTLRGYEVKTALTIAEARMRLMEAEPDIILLDVEMPDGNGIDFCLKIRPETAAHIIFLTAKAEHENRVRGLHYGGDDYIAKPFHPEELLARIEAAMRRRGMDATVQIITKGSLTLDVVAAQAFINGANVALTPKEFAILLLLVKNEGKVLSAEYIYECVWKAPLGGDKNAIQAMISKLRQKLELTEYCIDAVRNRGYIFR